ncbi:MAG: (deoxy)nucleoside triphosphate pyrophosphohydrolase [Gammaproteobacteria bacterium]|nr:(deoxy)nucleoside triphosphate pyrophosphohydrolase [Gammaproteobacteria bacterium]
MKQVVCAAFLRNGKILLARRAPGEHLAGFWELPGGKVEADETLAQALSRELLEELGVKARVGAELTRSIYHYERGSVELIALTTEFDGEVGHLSVHDAVQWCSRGALANLPIAPADIPLLDSILA